MPWEMLSALNFIAFKLGLRWWLSGNPPAKAGDVGLIPRWRRSPGGGSGNPLQYSCLGIPWTEEPGRLHNVATKQSWIYPNYSAGLEINV